MPKLLPVLLVLLAFSSRAQTPPRVKPQGVKTPGVQIPIALGATSKLPIGLELDGPAGSDRRLLAIGVALDSVFGRLPAPR